MMHPSDVPTVISPSALELPPTQSVDITDWVVTGEYAG